jgi:cyclohexanone monooxygenase
MVIGAPVEEDLVNDGWTDIFRSLSRAAKTRLGPNASRRDAAMMLEIADFEKMNGIRARVDNTVTDPEIAETLKPWYRQFCKRPTFNDDYLPTFNRPNVTLVDTSDSQGVERITKTGIVAGGVEYPVDCIIFATGFEVGTAYTRRAGFEVYGVGGVKLSDKWAGGMKTLHGLTSHGFPNCFHLGITQNTLTPNFPHMLDEQADYVADVVRTAQLHQARVAQPTVEAETEWVETIKRTAIQNIAFRSDCTPGYYNGEGRAGEGGGLFDGIYGPGSDAFFALAHQWRQSGMPGLEFR